MVLLVKQGRREVLVEDDNIDLLASAAAAVDHETRRDLVTLRQVGAENVDPVILVDGPLRCGMGDRLRRAAQLQLQLGLDVNEGLAHPRRIGGSLQCAGALTHS